VTVAGVNVSDVPVPIPVDNVVEKRLLYFLSLSFISAVIILIEFPRGWGTGLYCPAFEDET